MSRQFMRQMKKKTGGGGLGNMANMGDQMGSLMKMQEKMQEELGAKVVEGNAGGNMVVVRMSGRQELLSVKIDPSIVNAEEVDMLEDLITVAFRDALSKSQELGVDAMNQLTGGLNIPGLF